MVVVKCHRVDFQGTSDGLPTDCMNSIREKKCVPLCVVSSPHCHETSVVKLMTPSLPSPASIYTCQPFVVDIFLILIPFIGRNSQNKQKDFARARSAESAYRFDLFMRLINVEEKTQSRPLEENGYNEQCLEASVVQDCSDDC